MRINKEKNDSLVNIINFVEESMSKGSLFLSPDIEKDLKNLKIEAGLLVDVAVDFLGIEKGSYRFQAVRSDGVTKVFDINPDDIDIYQICLSTALEKDRDIVMRSRRLKEHDRFIMSIKRPENKSRLMNVDDAVKNTSNSGGLKINPISH